MRRPPRPKEETVKVKEETAKKETGPCVFDLPWSARPGGSEVAGGREKTKIRKQGGRGGRRSTHPPTILAEGGWW